MGLSSEQITEANRQRLDAGKRDKAETWNEEKTAREEIARNEFLKLHVGQNAYKSDSHGRPTDNSFWDCEANWSLLLNEVASNGEEISLASLEYAFQNLKSSGSLAGSWEQAHEPYEPKMTDSSGATHIQPPLPSLPETRVYFKQSKQELLALSADEMRRLLGGPNSAAKVVEFNRIVNGR